MNELETIEAIGRSKKHFISWWGANTSNFEGMSHRDFFDYITDANKIIDLQDKVLGHQLVRDPETPKELTKAYAVVADKLMERSTYSFKEDDLIGMGIGFNRDLATLLLSTIKAQDNIIIVANNLRKKMIAPEEEATR